MICSGLHTDRNALPMPNATSATSTDWRQQDPTTEISQRRGSMSRKLTMKCTEGLLDRWLILLSYRK